jgi:3-deoxy-D-manno-octulosonic-acid transferase
MDFRMGWLLNGLYILLLTALSPVIAWRCLRHGRYRRGLRIKLTGLDASFRSDLPTVWFHAVSVGEVVQLQKVVQEFRSQLERPVRIVVTTSTDTGFDLAQQRFPDCTVTWFPLDFSWAVSRTLRHLQPQLLVLMELELWPGLIAACARRHVPVAVVNARMSDHSVRGYRRIRPLIAPTLRRLTLVAAQSEQYADRLASLGTPRERIRCTGSIKFDGVTAHRDNPRTTALKNLFSISNDEVVFIAGSTQEPEEQLALQAWQSLREQWPELRLILVPRHRERFDDVAALVEAAGLPLLRRSQLPGVPQPIVPPTPGRTVSSEHSTGSRSRQPKPVILLDTIGELGACWGLAELAFVGGSFGARGGQNMIEPAAYGAVIMFGPNTSNFRDVVAAFRQADACLPLNSPEELLTTLRRLLQNPRERQERGDRARQVVTAQQGATRTTAALLCQLLPSSLSEASDDRAPLAA